MTTVTLDSHQTMRDAAARTEGVADSAYVVVRRRQGLDLFWYAFGAGFVREMAERHPDGLLIDVMNLHESGANPSYQISEVPVSADVGIVLDGAQAVGVLVGERARTRGPATPAARSAPRPGVTAPPPPLTWGESIAGRDAGPADQPAGDGDGGDASAEAFIAFPAMDCPSQVAVGRSFELVVMLTDEPQPNTVGGPVSVAVPTTLREFDLVVQVVARGFTADRVRDVLHVDRADLTTHQARFTLTAEPIDGALHPAILQVDFSFGGQLCGRAWRAIVVVSGADAASHAAATVGAAAIPSTPVVISVSDAAPDLVITITEDDDGNGLDWGFTTRHSDVQVPDDPVRTRFRRHNAKTFAMQQIRLAHQSIGDAAIGNRMLGIARTIADQIPPEAWQVVTAILRKTQHVGQPPSVLLVSTDAYVPWELASTEPRYIDPALLDPALPPFLGAQTCVSRWMAPRPRGARGALNPPLPPPAQHDVERMALVVGDYLAINGMRPLPKANEEGNILAAKYRAVRLSATLDEVDPMFDGRLQRDGEPYEPDVVHFACHGQMDPNPAFNGIVLNEANARLDEFYVAGNRMQRPFVFLNACQVGQATELLDSAGGLATAFLTTGASGFVAPLWNVDDQLAQDTALAFYAAALDEGVPVAEVLRRRRALFDPDAAAPQPTHLAYVYYGHPNLLLAHER